MASPYKIPAQAKLRKLSHKLVQIQENIERAINSACHLRSLEKTKHPHLSLEPNTEKELTFVAGILSKELPILKSDLAEILQEYLKKDKEVKSLTRDKLDLTAKVSKFEKQLEEERDKVSALTIKIQRLQAELDDERNLSEDILDASQQYEDQLKTKVDDHINIEEAMDIIVNQK